jgi:hypothetical protein
LTIQFEITEKDYINFNIDHYYRTNVIRIFDLAVRFVLPVLVSVFYMRNGITLQSIIASSIFAVIWVALYPTLNKTLIHGIVLLYLRSGKNNDFIGSQEIKLLDTYIEESNADCLTQIQYTSVERVCFGHNLCYVYIGAVKAIIVPMSAFLDEEHKKTFYGILSEKTGIVV